MVAALPGEYDTIGEVAGKISDMVTYGLAEDFYTKYPERVRGTSSASLTALAEERLQPDHCVIIVVGDRQKIEPGLRELNLGPIESLDPDGRPVSAAPSALR